MWASYSYLFFCKQKTAYELRISDRCSGGCSSDLGRRPIRQYFILGCALLVGLLFLGRWFVEADPHKLAGGLKWGGFAIAAVVLVLLLVSGRLGLLAALVPAGIWAFRSYQRYRSADRKSVV